MNSRSTRQKAKHVGEQVAGGAQQVADHQWFTYLARAGYVMSGLVHAGIGWICLRLGFGGSAGENADQSGALATFAHAPGGAILLIMGAVAMIALALMHVLEVFFGEPARQSGNDKIFAVAKTLGKAIMYVALGFTAFRFGLGGRSDSGDDAEGMAAPLLSSGIGRVVIGAVGLAIIGVGIYHVYKGLTRKFKEDLNPTGDHKVAHAIEKTGLVGYVAKGIALAGVGVMVMWAAISVDPEKARGMDAAFKEILSLPAGGVLLGAVGVGFIIFGVYSVLRAKYQTFSQTS